MKPRVYLYSIIFVSSLFIESYFAIHKIKEYYKLVIFLGKREYTYQQ